MAKSLNARIQQMQNYIDALLRFQIATLTFQGVSERGIAKQLRIPRWVVRNLGNGNGG